MTDLKTPKALLLFPVDQHIGDCEDTTLICMIPLFENSTFFDRMRAYTKVAVDASKALSTVKVEETWDGTAWLPSRMQHHELRELLFPWPAMFGKLYKSLDENVFCCDHDVDLSDLLFEQVDVVSRLSLRKMVAAYGGAGPAIVRYEDFDQALVDHGIRDFASAADRWDAFTQIVGLDGDGDDVFLNLDNVYLSLRVPYVLRVGEEKLGRNMRFMFRGENGYEAVTSRIFDVTSFVNTFEDAFKSL